MDEDIEFKRGDELALAGDQVALEYGWWAAGWIDAEAQRAGEPGGAEIGERAGTYPDSRADPNSRAAFSYALSILEKRHRKSLSHGQIADRIRVGRAFPKQKYDDLIEELHYNFTFSQLRAAYERDEEEQTMGRLLRAAETDASPDQIYAWKMGANIETDLQKAWRHMVEWAYRYRERACAHPWTDENKDCDGLAKQIIDYDQKKKKEAKK
jgi:hypothetical protein